MITNLEQYKNVLVEKGIKPTYQRIKILEYMSKNTKNHPTVEMIHEELLKAIPTISMTTVYNTLNSLLEKGLVSGVTITGTEIRYDLDSNFHHHFLCKKCGKIINIDIRCPFAEGKKTTVNGNKIDEVHGYFKGICKDCSKRMKNKAKQRSAS